MTYWQFTTYSRNTLWWIVRIIYDDTFIHILYRNRKMLQEVTFGYLKGTVCCWSVTDLLYGNQLFYLNQNLVQINMLTNFKLFKIYIHILPSLFRQYPSNVFIVPSTQPVDDFAICSSMILSIHPSIHHSLKVRRSHWLYLLNLFGNHLFQYNEIFIEIPMKLVEYLASFRFSKHSSWRYFY